jgi:trehalose/maltose hydrolase-like predicted phosphorylase
VAASSKLVPVRRCQCRELAHTVHAIGAARGPAQLISAHITAWQQRWIVSDVEIDGDPETQKALRFATYHLISAANPADEHVSVGARGLTGEGYLGHVFWDTDIFLLPFYTLTWPEAARAMLMYRYHGLPAARAKAAQLGYRGALYAWESVDSGQEATPSTAIARDGRVVAILCGTLEQHISGDVAYAVWQYWHATRDVPFLLDAGAEIILETARFWASRATPDQDGSYHIRGVIGPDEYHETVDDNAYTNGLAVWNLERGLEVAALFGARWPARWTQLLDKLQLSSSELDTWRQVAHGMATMFDPGSGLIEQFHEFFALEDIDLRAYALRTAPMDVVLGAKRIRQTQVIKQADVLMLLSLFPNAYDRRVQLANFRYYEPRCGHGSSLSPAVHAQLAARLGQLDLACRYLCRAASIDLDASRGEGAEGVHMAALGGVWQAAVFGFGGLELGATRLRVNPRLPVSWRRLAFPLRWRRRQIHFEIDRERAQVRAQLECGQPLMIEICGRAQRLCRGSTVELPLEQPTR